MQLTATLAALALPLLALAAPAADTTAAAAAPKKFYLKAQVPKATHPAAHKKFDGTYVEFYHTGAGTNDVQLASVRKNAELGYINATSHQLQFHIPDGGQNIPWTAALPTLVQYSAWQAVTIDIGYGNNYGHFYNSKVGVRWSSLPYGDKGIGGANDEFGGWLVCDWWHSVPQLFWLNKFYVQEGDVPSDNCEVVQLIPDYV